MTFYNPSGQSFETDLNTGQQDQMYQMSHGCGPQ